MHNWTRILAVTLLLSLLSQGLAAAAAPCAIKQVGESSISPAQVMEHAAHGMILKSDDPAGASGCCAAMCFCSVVNCLSLVALPASLFTANSTTPDPPVIVLAPSLPRYSPELLYRPPILA